MLKRKRIMTGCNKKLKKRDGAGEASLVVVAKAVVDKNIMLVTKVDVDLQAHHFLGVLLAAQWMHVCVGRIQILAGKLVQTFLRKHQLTVRREISLWNLMKKWKRVFFQWSKSTWWKKGTWSLSHREDKLWHCQPLLES